MAQQPCKEPGCERKKMRGRHRCGWHHLLTLSIDDQVRYAMRRLELKQQRPGFVMRSRVAPKDWPEGTRFCAGCQCFVPTFYVSGSRCKACASKAQYLQHVASTYDLDKETYQRLLVWQDGRCFICGQQPRGRRLAVDHDHRTGEVRGLLCANDEWGCNVSLRRLLDSKDMARLAYAYVYQSPLARMLAGQEPVARRRSTVAEQTRRAILGTSA